MRLSGTIPIVAAALALGLPLTADAQGARQGGPAAPQAPKSFNAELKAAADALGKMHQVRIVVDPSIFVASPPAVPSETETLDAAIGKLSAGLKNVAWRKVYVPEAEASAAPSPERLSAMVRALDMLETGGLVLENPATRRAASLQKNLPVMPGFADELRARKFSPAPIYVLYSTFGGGAGRTPEERFLDLQRQQLDMMMQMDPDTLSQTFARGMQMWMSLDPQTRGQLFANMMKAGTQMFMQMDPATRTQMVGSMVRSGMEMWANMPADQRQKMTQEMMQMGQQLAGELGMQPGGRPPR